MCEAFRMVRISIVALIYKSPLYADFVYEQIHKYTPQLRSGEAEFFFVANDASEEVLQHLAHKNYPFVLHENPRVSEEELFRRGIGAPEYIHRVYRAWNRCIQEAKGDWVCLVNSDMGFSPNWLDNLLKHSNEKKAVSSLLIERGHETLGHFPDSLNGTGSIVYYCGKTPLQYDGDRFIGFVQANRMRFTNKTTTGGVYMPILFHRQTALDAGLYPEGNIAGSSFHDVVDYGDRVFMRRMKERGVAHVTAWDSMVYHFQQGEMEF